MALPRNAKRRRLGAGVADSYATARAQADAEAALTASGRRSHDLFFSSDESEDAPAPPDLDSLELPARRGLAPPWAGVFTRAGEIGEARRARRAESMPAMALPPGLATELEKVVRGGRVVRQPLFVEDPRVAARPRAHSVVRAKMAHWMESEEGRRWQMERHARYEEAAQ